MKVSFIRCDICEERTLNYRTFTDKKDTEKISFDICNECLQRIIELSDTIKQEHTRLPF